MKLLSWARLIAGCAGIVCASLANASIIVDYTNSIGGSSFGPLNGLSARATFEVSGTSLDILLENTSTGAPADFDGADGLLVSLAFDLPDGVAIASSTAAVIGPGSQGLGAWSDREPGDSVAEEWVWTNNGSGDLLSGWSQVITTSNGTGAGTPAAFGATTNVSGPYGGIAAAPPLFNVPGSQRAVSNGIAYSLTLTAPVTEAQLYAGVMEGVVEFGSDRRYLSTPEPTSLVGLLALRRR